MSYGWLPGVLEQIAETAGLEAALKLARTHGGTFVYIPAFPTEGHWLTQLVGMHAAEKICGLFQMNSSGARVLIPMARKSISDRTIAMAMERKLSARSTATLAGVHERTVYRHRRRRRKSLKANRDQLKLF